MEEWLSPILPTFSLAVAVSAALYAAFSWTNKSVSTDIREHVALWILGEPGQAPWLEGFCSMFYALFGNKQLSRRGVVSLLAATLLIASAAFVWLHYFDTTDENGDPRFAPGGIGAWDLQLFFMMIVLYALPIQFITMGFVRLLLRKLAVARNLFAPIFLFFLVFVSYAVVNRLWLIVLQLPYFLYAQSGTAVSEFMDWYAVAFAIQIEYSGYRAPGFVATIMPLLLLLIAIGITIARRVYFLSNHLFKRASRFLSKERVEKEPILLVGEAISAMAFVVICVIGLAS